MEKNERAEILRLKEIMQELGWSRAKLAKEAGLTPTTISNIHSGLHLPSIENLQKIANVMDVDIRELFNPSKKGSISTVEIEKAKEHLTNALTFLGG